MELKDFIYIRDEVMPLSALSSLLKWIDKKSESFEEARIITENQNNIIDPNIRKVENLQFNLNSKSKTELHWHNFLAHCFRNLCMEYQKEFSLDACLTKFSEITILKYQNHGHYTFHSDHHATAPRTLSLIYLLNNDYEEGNLVFGNPNCTEEILRIEKIPNRVIIWPSNFLYPHKVVPVTKGTRYSIVAWAV